MTKFKIVFLLVLLISIDRVNANSITKAFSALNSFNYFEAKRLFEKSMKNEVAAASFGLSNIYFRSDNPFSQIDTAFKYILISDSTFQTVTSKKKLSYMKFNISQQTIDSLKNEIYSKAFNAYKSHNRISELDKFIVNYPASPQFNDAIDLRNSLAFREAKKKDTYQAYQAFLDKYPLAKEVPAAKERYAITLFKVSTINNTLDEFEKYLINQPQSPFLSKVENSIYSLSTTKGTIKEYHNFIKKHPKNHNVETAWHNIYALYTADYKTESLVDFRLEFPDYPFSDIVNQEIELSQKSLYGVRENGKWGFADSIGSIVIPCTYEWVENFSEGFAECGLNGKSGFINKSGKVMIPFNYEQVEPFKHGLSIVQQGNKYGIINKNGKLIVPFEYDEISEFSEGLAVVSKSEKYGYINETGKLVIPANYTKAGDFKENLAVVESDGLIGYINSSGTIVIPCKFDWAEKFNNGLAKVKSMKKFGIINKNSTYLLPCEYDMLGEFCEDAIMVIKENKYGFADRQGIVFIPIEYDYTGNSMVSLKYLNGLTVAEKNKKQGLIDKKGKYVTTKNFDRIKPFSEGLAANQRKDKWGYIDEKAKVQIQYLYKSADEFINGIAKVTDKNGKIGFINRSGKTAINFLFDEADIFKNGLCTVLIDEKKGIIDASGVWILPCEFDSIIQINGSVLKLEKNSKIAYYNILNREYFWKEIGF